MGELKIPAKKNWSLDNVPDELKQIPQWVCWKYQRDKGKLRKPPVNTSGYCIDETDSMTWMTFDEARAAYLKNKRVYGISLVLTPDLNLVGYDADKCIDENGNLDPDVEEDLATMGSYAEVSPSGIGVRVFTWGSIPADGRKSGRFEMYRNKRHLTVTGLHIDSAPATVEQNQAGIDAVFAKRFSRNGTKPDAAEGQGQTADQSELSDAVLLGKARNAKNGAKFTRLWSGDISGYASQSEADIALCSLLAFWWGKDAVAIDRMFRQSGLYREKWDKKHGDQTYGQMTIAAAVSKTGETYSQGERESEPEYFFKDGMTFRNVPTKAGTIPSLLANIECVILREAVKDDGAEKIVTFEMSARLRGRTQTFELPASKFPGMAWVTEQLGASAIVRAGQGNKDHLRAAIQSLSGQPEREELFTHCGWRKIEKSYVYLTGRGAIGSDGFVPGIKTDLGQLSHYDLPAPPTGAELTEAVRRILAFFKSAPCGLPASILLPYRAVLNVADPCDYSGYFAAPTGYGKSEWAAYLQSFFGKEMGYSRNLPGNFASTANALEKRAFLTKDSIFVIDDYCPSGGQSDVAKLNHKADLVFRGAGNRSGRQRLNADSSERATYYPRGLSIGTGEDIPAGQSLRSRLWIWELTESLQPGLMSNAQALSRTGITAQTMSGFIAWAAPRIDDLKQSFPKEKEALRAELNAGSHARHATTIADLLQTAEVFADFATDIGAIEYFESRGWISEIKAELLKLADAQGEYLVTENPAQRFVKLLGSALSAGRVHVIDAKTGSVPAEDAHLWGWAWKGSVSAAPETYGEDVKHYYPQGERIGWLSGGDLYLDPDAAFAAAQRLGRDQGQGILLSQNRLWKNLKTAGLLAGTDRDRNTHKVKLDGAYRATIHLPARDVVEGLNPKMTQEETEWLMSL